MTAALKRNMPSKLVGTWRSSGRSLIWCYMVLPTRITLRGSLHALCFQQAERSEAQVSDHSVSVRTCSNYELGAGDII